ncbi:3-hydroxyacyl-CoA dehydrogenase type-2-like [Bombus fervidus]|uniref:3-hydroxyacyl-CoA dehydrogenase type-2-like n=1 Tax=Bombus fervidus TaxID=203811 RepID=UPI003AB1FA3F
MTIPLARGLASQGIRVITICWLHRQPNYSMLTQTSSSLGQSLSRSNFFFRGGNPHRHPPLLEGRRYGPCKEVAHLIQACIENPLINGANIRIDMG